MEEKDPVLERNFIIFMILTMLVIFGWMYFFGNKQPFKKPTAPEKPGISKPEPKPGQPSPSPAPGSTAIIKPAPVTGNTATISPAPGKPGQIKPLSPAPGPQFETKIIEVESKLYRIKFSTKGGVPVSWELKKYMDKVYYPYEINLKWPPLQKVAKFTPEPVQLINPGLATTKPALRSKIIINNFPVPEDAVWQSEDSKIVVDKNPASVTFSLPLAHGIVLKKVYTFYPDKYSSDLKVSFEGGEADPNISEVDFSLSYVFEPLNRLARINFHGPVLHNGQKIIRVPLKDLDKGNESKQDGVAWAGFTESYFLTALLAPPDAPMIVHSYYSGDDAALRDKNSAKEYSIDITSKPIPRLLSDHELADLSLYFGPKEKDLLQSTRSTLALAIDYGWFAPIAMPLDWVLLFINKGVKNFGWSIVIFTIILRMAMFPLTRKSQQSMKEMQKLQPEMDKIRKKYPNDRMKQQEEMYALQRKYKINPMGGCLPMLVQIPVFFAFYKVLVVSIELRHAPWILWIPDLSSRDPLLILPLIMGLSQFVMQRLTPMAGADPTQAKMMQMMPLVFTFLMIYFPAGLLLYWTVSNIIGIGQQIYVNKYDQKTIAAPGKNA